MIRTTGQAIKRGQAVSTALEEIRLSRLRQAFNYLSGFYLKKLDFDRAIYFAVQAQFYREALESVVRHHSLT